MRSWWAAGRRYVLADGQVGRKRSCQSVRIIAAMAPGATQSAPGPGSATGPEVLDHPARPPGIAGIRRNRCRRPNTVASNDVRCGNSNGEDRMGLMGWPSLIR